MKMFEIRGWFVLKVVGIVILIFVILQVLPILVTYDDCQASHRGANRASHSSKVEAPWYQTTGPGVSLLRHLPWRMVRQCNTVSPTNQAGHCAL